MSFYLDTSVLVPLHVEQPDTPIVTDWAERADGAFLVADLAAAEFCSAVSRQVRMGSHSQEQANERIAMFEQWRAAITQPVENRPEDIRTAAELVRIPYPRLLTPDAIHLATCRRLRLTLVAFDVDLLAVAGRLGIASVRPGAA